MKPRLGTPRVSVMSEVVPSNQIASRLHAVALNGPMARIRCTTDEGASERHAVFFHTSALAECATDSLAQGFGTSAGGTENPGRPVTHGRVWAAASPATLWEGRDRDIKGIWDAWNLLLLALGRPF